MCLFWKWSTKKSIQVVVTPELAITDTVVVSAVKRSLQHGGG